MQTHGNNLNTGHYTSLLNLDKQWIKCDDRHIANNSIPTASDGYIYIYELDDPSQKPCSSLEVNRNTLNINTNNNNESNKY